MWAFTVSLTDKGWMIQREEVRRGWFGTPARIGGYYSSKKAALAVAQQLAGRDDRVTVSEAANSLNSESALSLLAV